MISELSQIISCTGLGLSRTLHRSVHLCTNARLLELSLSLTLSVFQPEGVNSIPVVVDLVSLGLLKGTYHSFSPASQKQSPTHFYMSLLQSYPERIAVTLSKILTPPTQSW